MIRRALPGDRTTVEAIVREAYSGYIERIGKPPGPMLDDYAALIESGAVNVAIESNDAIPGSSSYCANPTICCSTMSRCVLTVRG